MVPSARLELALPNGQGFSYHHYFRSHSSKSVCSLDYTFTCTVLRVQSLHLPEIFWLGSVLAVKPPPNLRSSTFRVSSEALKFFNSSPLCLPISPRGPFIIYKCLCRNCKILFFKNKRTKLMSRIFKKTRSFY